MGMFNWVEVYPTLLPDEYSELTGWQTKDVSANMLNTLIVDKYGKLYLKWPSWYLDGDEPRTDELDYTGEMCFYTFREPENPQSELVYLNAVFIHGKLESIKEIKYD